MKKLASFLFLVLSFGLWAQESAPAAPIVHPRIATKSLRVGGTDADVPGFSGNAIRHNDRDGLFVCWRVYQGRVAGNRFRHNGWYGICTGHKDTHVLFENNHIHHNGSDGVHLRSERESNAPHRNTFLMNTIADNGTRGKGYGFSINAPASDLLLKENRFLNSSGTQVAAIMVYRAGLKPHLEDNYFEPHEQGEMVVE